MELSIDISSKLFNVLLFNQFLKSVLIRESVKIPLSQSTVDTGKISPIAASLVRLGNIDIISSSVRTMTHQRLHTMLSNFFIYCFLNIKVKASNFLSYKVCNVNFYFYEVHIFHLKYLLYL